MQKFHIRMTGRSKEEQRVLWNELIGMGYKAVKDLNQSSYTWSWVGTSKDNPDLIMFTDNRDNLCGEAVTRVEALEAKVEVLKTEASFNKLQKLTLDTLVYILNTEDLHKLIEYVKDGNI